jgi:signal transduction histidine kinase
MVDNVTTTYRRLSSYTQDTMLAAVLTVLGWLSLLARPTFSGGPRGGSMPLQPVFDSHPLTPWPAYALVAAGFLPLAVRRRFPLSVLAVTSVAAASYQVLHVPPSMVFAAPLVALYTVGTLRERRVLLVAGVLSAAAAMSVSLPAFTDSGFWAEFVRVISVYGVAAALGDATRNRRAYVAEVEQRAAEAERTREEEAARRVDEERLRIARELHDVTAHSLSIVAVQSGAAIHVIETDPVAARKALEAIRRTAKDALDELRAMLGVLRSPGDADAPWAPVPGLARIPDLVAPLLEAGYGVEVTLPDDLGEVPTVVQFSAYRIVQEALTNVVRHAGNCRVDLSMRREGDALLVRVDDDGNSPPPSDLGRGHGLAGMRERVAALGGTFTAGPRDGGGFSVTARLPIGAKAGE